MKKCRYGENCFVKKLIQMLTFLKIWKIYDIEFINNVTQSTVIYSNNRVQKFYTIM